MCTHRPCCVSKELSGSEQSETSCQETQLLIAQSGRRRGSRDNSGSHRDALKANNSHPTGCAVLKVGAGWRVSLPERGGAAAGFSC